MRECLGDVVAALVDGELDHPARERAQRHLAHCGPCRASVESQRRLKSQFGGLLGGPGPSDALTARLLALSVPGQVPVRPAGPRVQERLAPAVPVRSSPRGRVSGRGRARRRLRSAGAGTILVVVGLGVVLALGGPTTQAPSTPVDPGSDVFVADFVSTTSGGARSPR